MKPWEARFQAKYQHYSVKYNDMNNMYRQRKKINKKRGSVLKILPVFLGIAAVTVLSLMYLYYARDMDVREQATQVIREYLLDMEAEGCLTDQAKTELVDRLRDIGLENINLSGTTMNNAGYGNEIILRVNAVVKVTRFALTNLLDPDVNTGYESFNCVRKSTAKN